MIILTSHLLDLGMSNEEYRLLGRNQKVNRFPEVGEITRKDNMYRNLSRMAQLYGKQHFDFFPQSMPSTIACTNR